MPDSQNADRARRAAAVITRTFHLPASTPDDALRMGSVSGWDSMGHIEVVVELEKEFGVTFPSYAVADLTSVDDIVRSLAALSPDA